MVPEEAARRQRDRLERRGVAAEFVLMPPSVLGIAHHRPEGTLILEQDRVVEARLRREESAFVVAESMDEISSSASPVVSDHSAHQAVIENFIHAIETDSTTACDGYEGRLSLALIESIYRAARNR